MLSRPAMYRLSRSFTWLERYAITFQDSSVSFSLVDCSGKTSETRFCCLDRWPWQFHVFSLSLDCTPYTFYRYSFRYSLFGRNELFLSGGTILLLLFFSFLRKPISRSLSTKRGKFLSGKKFVRGILYPIRNSNRQKCPLLGKKILWYFVHRSASYYSLFI